MNAITTTEVSLITDAELAAAFRTRQAQQAAAKQAAIDATQPMVDDDYILIESSYDFDGLMIDLYGEVDAKTSRTEVYTATVSGSKVSLWRIVPQSTFEMLSEKFN